MNKPMTLVPVTTYGVVSISVNPSNGKFYANIASGMIEAASLSAIKKQIDDKGSKVFKGFVALRRRGYGEGVRFEEVRINSIKVRGGRKVWADDKGRELNETMYHPTVENIDLLAQELAMDKQHSEEREAMRNRHNAESDALTKKFTHIDIHTYVMEQA